MGSNPDRQPEVKEINVSDEAQDKGMLNCSAVKALAKEYDYRIGDGALNQLGKEVKLLIAKSIRRAESNGRKTIKEQDV